MTIAKVGESQKRSEDHRFITGNGTYVDDVRLPGLAHVAFVRSPHAHALIRSIDASAAAAAPGVQRIFTGAELQEQLGSLPIGWELADQKSPPHPPLAFEKVRYVGDAVAAIVADSPYAAQDAVELVRVEYEPLDAVIDGEKATKQGAPQLHDEAPGNVSFTWEVHSADQGYEGAAKEADVVIKQRIVNQRLIPNAMETRGVVADFNAGTEHLTIWTSTQIPHLVRLLFCAITGHPEHKVRIIAPDVGGAFGSKLYLYAEEVVLGIIARNLKRPVKWIESRQENYIATTHGRDHIADVEMCGNRDGTITGFKVNVYANLGAYLSTFAAGIPTILYGLLLSGVYKFEHVSCVVTGVFTNTTPVDAYRGAGRPEATFLMERMVDMFAAEIGRDPVAVRRKNFLPAFKNGKTVATGVTYDSGNYRAPLNRALEMFDYAEFRREQKEARRNGRLIGVGFSTYIEISGLAPSAVAASLGAGAGLWESSTVRVHPSGTVTVYTGTASSGQGHETTFAQIASAELGVPFEDIDVIHGDTEKQPFGTGTFGSRSVAVGGQALMMSLKKVNEKAARIAAQLMNVEPKQVRVRDGIYTAEDIPDRQVTFAEVAAQAYSATDLPPNTEPGLEAVSFYDPENFTWPFGCHICVIEVSPDTGETKILRYVAVDDIGNVINPMIVDGMLHGGIAQGIGQAMQEAAVYSDDGQLLSGSMLDYAVPTAEDMPMFETDRTVTPSPVNELGTKGAGEAGTIAASPAVINAAVDALAHLGVRHIDMPLRPESVWRIIRDAREKQRAERSAKARQSRAGGSR